MRPTAAHAKSMKLDSNDSTPLYLQLKAELRTAITEQIYGCNEKIPTEIQLSQQYGVSRITVRQAVQELCEEGYLVKKQGKGTFVRQRRISRKLENLMSFTQACTANGMTPSTSVLERRVDTLSRAEQELFGEDGQGRYFILKRLRMADSTPVMLETNYFPLPQYDFLQGEDLSGSLYRALDRRGIRIHANRDVTLDVVLADSALAQQMGVSRGTPLFDMVGKNYDRSGALVHLGREYIVCDRYHFSLADYIVAEEDYNGL